MSQRHSLSRLKPLRLKFLILSLLLFGLVLATAVTYRSFYPTSRYDLPGEDGKRLFSVLIDSADGKVLIKAADWPYTFFAPFTLGESNWPERDEVSKFHWSKDKSVAVFLAKQKGESAPIYSGAYDFQEHKGMERKASKELKEFFSKKIETLLSERGGLEDAAVEIPAPNTGAYERR